MRGTPIVSSYIAANNGHFNNSPQQAVFPGPTSREIRLQKAKARLLNIIDGTARGSTAAIDKRGEIEEAQVAVEAFSRPEADWAWLPGTWQIVYTTAPDVVPLVRPSVRLPLRIGNVGQRFSDIDEGRVENLIEIELLGPVVDGSKLTLAVEARYEIRTGRSIVILFQNAGLSEFLIGDALQNFIAPSLLPRGYANMAILMALSQLAFKVPLGGVPAPVCSGSFRQSRGANYSISYLDTDMLIGRSAQGTFIFCRDPDRTFEAS